MKMANLLFAKKYSCIEMYVQPNPLETSELGSCMLVVTFIVDSQRNAFGYDVT